MDIKVGDIVNYRDEDVRIMVIIGKNIHLDKVGWVTMPDDGFNIVSSKKYPEFEVGDIVTIMDIPSSERYHYGCGWGYDMNEMVGGEYTIRGIRDTDDKGLLVKLDIYWFQVYHIKPVSEFDII